MRRLFQLQPMQQQLLQHAQSLSRWWNALLAPVDIAWLAGFRILYGTVITISLLRFIGYGWIDMFFVTPTFHFTYWGFSWVEPLPGWGMHALFYGLTVAAVCVATGLFFRVASWMLFAGFVYLQLIDVATYINHYYLMCLMLLLLAVSPAHRAWSLDTYLGRVAAWRQVPALYLVWMRVQVGVVYTYAGIAKLHGDWLLHGQPLRIWLSSRTELPILGPMLFAWPWLPEAMSWAGFLFDISVVWFLLWPKARPWAYAVVIVFHSITRSMFPIGMFSMIMVMCAAVFFAPDWPRVVLRKIGFEKWWRGVRGVAQVNMGMSVPRVPTWMVAIAAVYCVIQVALPLRFLAYGGNVRWHEQGMRFSWRVMVREKNGDVMYRVRHVASGREKWVSTGAYLTSLQEREMSTQPDLIVQLGHRIGRDVQAQWGGIVQVFVDARVSLNGRPSAVLIDPQVDIMGVTDGVAKATWIMPAPESAPPKLAMVR